MNDERGEVERHLAGLPTILEASMSGGVPAPSADLVWPNVVLWRDEGGQTVTV